MEVLTVLKAMAQTLEKIAETNELIAQKNSTSPIIAANSPSYSNKSSISKERMVNSIISGI